MAGKDPVSFVKNHNGVPSLFDRGTPFPAAGYMTYLPERGCYEAFARAGYRLFSLPVFFAGKSFSTPKSVRPFGKGIFDRRDRPDFGIFDDLVRRVLSAAPDARLLPRVNVSLPDWWLADHPDCADATGAHESLFSAEAAQASADLLRQFIAHVNESPYAGQVIGYHLAGGNTEEWFHFDRELPLCAAAKNGFQRYLAAHAPELDAYGSPDLSLLRGAGPFHGSEPLSLYLAYVSEAVTEHIGCLARAAKEASYGKAVVGVFYGYSLEVTSPLFGTHALTRLLSCGDIDFVCSPNSYIGCRDPGCDWTEMYPAASVRLHGKLCFQECDIRTHLTKPLAVCAPEYDPEYALNAPIWNGLPDKKAALHQIRKSFCRQLIGGNAFWWFDMWGGWYDDDEIMAEMAAYRRICGEALRCEDRSSVSEIAVFTDETAYRYMTECALRNAAFDQRKALGLLGAPFDIYDVADFSAVYMRYKVVVILAGKETDTLRDAVLSCEKTHTPYLVNSERKPTFSVGELREFCRHHGVHIYCDSNDIVYVNTHYCAVCAVSGGVRELRFKKDVTLAQLLGGTQTFRGRTVRFDMDAQETVLFRIDP